LSKTPDAFRTISEVAEELGVPKHVLRFWESRFPQIRPMKRGGGRRYYRPEDLALLRGICHLLHAEGYTIKGVQKILREQGIDHVKHIGAQGQKDAAAAAPPAAKRGRPAKARRPGSPIVTTSLAVSARAMTPAPSDMRAHIKTALAELEICRSILLGKAIESTGRRRIGKTRRAARP